MTYTVSLTLSIESENKEEAVRVFCEEAVAGDWDSASLDVEIEKEDS